MESVDPAVWRRTKKLFLAALDVPPGQRDAFLAARRGARPFSPQVPGARQGGRPAVSERSAASTDITGLLAQWSHGDRHALDQVLPLVYLELRKIASGQLRKERNGHNLDPSDLVHALFVQLVDQQHASWHNRAQFFATAARMMRRILVDPRPGPSLPPSAAAPPSPCRWVR